MAGQDSQDHRLFFNVSALFVVAHLVHSFFKGYSEAYSAMTISGLMTPLILVPFALWHGYLRFGAKKIAFFLIMVSIISWAYKSLSIATGFPFGHYNYSDLLGLKIGTVPLSIMPTYFAFGYLAWNVGDALLSKFDNTVRGWELFLVPFIASFIMVSWDVTMDPINSTITKAWLWHDGGSYFGVPVINFLGWFLCVFTFYVVFAFYSQKSNQDAAPQITGQKLFWQFPAFLYLTIIAEYVAGWFARPSVQVTSAEQHVWWTGDIYGSMTLVSLFTVVPFFTLAMYRISKEFDRT